ncbi:MULTISPECIES: nodulation efficiency, NfeD-like protein [Halomonadaceae]|jgi:membrane protein implicated in regulation of membrane protease activity|uniref:Nodulation efficiency, NfeD-like protein n=1 Tax=Vreelandella piezotolerans TaxID=2609667 RepID=A0ABQ6XC42_9GAMM|nr:MULTISPECIES: nodulation efficiency, NfeD-like protein [Halomonas]KAE8439588.1 nodulation efficiency, NfeD-like protein [Halomonas piezotolerans]MCG7578112.1 nodulation efficiency, NfeD-like protein [Halomonas sp. MMH1-48]MCG7591820.1 nodulation efficiency, NfeD-like protein [Halomonas sp. McD50-5]MCG7605214.1 nodulation efficiency, NfeD-like protein [Halomonas sp. MM17-34]MCG7614430.1 nodulation efficiency, NfeD-like protein [Halomonas sp. MM17-29]|tara:strand:+ start:48 stop:542 length:495 start_codon:yes stop_codon:yes gene_type:complete
MDWNPAYSWLVLALLLSLAELTSGAMVLLALGIAAALTAAVTALGLSLPWQLLSMGIFAGVMVPVGVMVIRPRFSPKGVAYGTTGTGVEKGNRYTTLLREYDQATGIKVNGDFFRLRVLESGQTELPEGTQVVFKRFEGTTALVTLTPSDTDDRSRATPNTQES